MLSFILWIIFGAVVGWLAGLLFKGGGFGFWVNVLVGIVGCVFGGWLFGKFGMASGSSFSIWGLIVGVIGAIILLWILSLIKKLLK